jgi:hypothetical protein
MYIEFSLPSGAGGMAAGYTAAAIKKDLEIWSKKYDIEFLAIKTVKYTLRVTFADPTHYNFFALTWDQSATKNFVGNWKKFRFVEPMSPPKSID